MLATASPAAVSPAPARSRRAELLPPALLVAAYAVLLLLNLSVPQPTDHSHYMDAAKTFPHRPKNPIADHQYLRIGLTAPTALVMRFFGYSEVTYHAVPVAAALLLFVSVYAIGRMMFGRLVGALSAAVLGCVGLIVVAGTELLPDLPATALFTTAVAIAVAIRQRLLVRGRRFWLVVIGLLLAWSYLVREFIPFVWPVVAVLLWRRIGRWEWPWALVPMAVAEAGEIAFDAHEYGDPLARFHAGSGLGDLPSRPEVAATFHDLPLWVYVERLPQQLARLPEGPGLLLLLALTLAAGLVALVRDRAVLLDAVRLRRPAAPWSRGPAGGPGRAVVPGSGEGAGPGVAPGATAPGPAPSAAEVPAGGLPEGPASPGPGRPGHRRAGTPGRRGSVAGRRAGLFAGWVLVLWVPLTLLGGVLNPDHPKLRLQLLRYWYPVFPAFVLGGVAALWLAARAVRWRHRRWSGVAPVALVCCVALGVGGLAAFGRPGRPGWVGSPRVSSRALPEFRSWLARTRPPVVWADAKLFRILPIYTVTRTGHRIWHGRLRPLTNAGQPAAGDYVVAYSVGSDACPRCGDAARAVLPGVPSTWRPVLTSHDRLLHVWRAG